MTAVLSGEGGEVKQGRKGARKWCRSRAVGTPAG